MKNKCIFHKDRRKRLILEELESRVVLSGAQPSGTEQLMLEELNDIRADPAAYGATIGVDLSAVAPAQPLAFDPELIQAASAHAQDMNAQGYMGQNTPAGVDPGQRITQAGFTWITWGESDLGGSAYSEPAQALKALIVDAGDSTLATRDQLLGIGPVFQTQTEIGIGVVQNGSGPLQNYYTLTTVDGLGSTTYLTGTVFNDANGDTRYATGEGMGGVLITASGPLTVNTTTFGSGGYTLQLPSGQYTITASGGGLSSPISQQVTITTSNVRLNFALPNSALQTGANAWVIQLYQDLLGRTPTPQEVAGWAGQLAQGTSQAVVAAGFINSQEYDNDLVAQWFEQYLGRGPDATGLAYFSSQLSQGVSQDSIRLGILASNEFYTHSGGTNSSFVTALYQDLLARTPDGTEANGWIATAATNRTAVVTGFLQSAEFRARVVAQYYQTFLRRQADVTGLDNFVAQLENGQDERTVVEAIVTSPEYYNGAPNILWIESLYRNVLDRVASNAEVSGWFGALQGGLSLAQIASDFTSSAEYDTLLVTQAYQTLLNRAPDAAGLALFVGMLQNTGNYANVVATIAGSGEFIQDQQGNDTQFVQALYKDLFFRLPTESELSYWLGEIQGNGASLSQVANLFVNSQEFQDLEVEKAFSLYMQRSPTSDELTQYVGALQNGQTDTVVAARILSSSEYFDFVSS